MAIVTQMINGYTIVSDGTVTKRVPTYGYCRERLIKLLEEAGGDANADSVREFWMHLNAQLREKEGIDLVFHYECILALTRAWDDLITPPTVQEPEAVDLFSAMGI